MFNMFCQTILKKINIIDDETNGFSDIHFNLMYIILPGNLLLSIVIFFSMPVKRDFQNDLSSCHTCRVILTV